MSDYVGWFIPKSEITSQEVFDHVVELFGKLGVSLFKESVYEDRVGWEGLVTVKCYSTPTLCWGDNVEDVKRNTITIKDLEKLVYGKENTVEIKIGGRYLVKSTHRKVEVIHESVNHSGISIYACKDLDTNSLLWVGDGAFLKPISKNLSTLFEELQQEINKAFECGKYKGVVFVHPSDVEDVVKFIGEASGTSYDEKFKTFNFPKGSRLKIDTIERVKGFPQHDYAGWEITTVILHKDFFGKLVGDRFEDVNPKTPRNGGNQDFIMYMLSRLRSASVYDSRLVYL